MAYPIKWLYCVFGGCFFMGVLMLALTGLGLSMDAFAVSITTGICIRDLKPWHAVKTGLFFGIFQFLMPLIGYLAGSTVASYIEGVDHWIAFLLLAIIGGKMIHDALKGEEEEAADPTQTKKLFILAVATSIDALAVGISFAMIGANIWLAAGLTGVITFLMSVFGVAMGKRLGDTFQKKAMLVGGIVLCLIGLKILIEHLVM